MGKGGRPRKEINWEEFDKLCALHCTLEEVASWFDCSVDTIERAVRRRFKSSFAEVYRQKSGKGKVSLRRAMWQRALAGNTALMIWISKNHLGMTDKVEQKVEETKKIETTVYKVGWDDESDGGASLSQADAPTASNQ